MTPTRLIFVPLHADLPARTWLVDGDSSLIQALDLTLETASSLRSMRTIAIVPGADVLVRRVELAPGGAVQLRAAALWMLRDDLAASPDRLTVALGSPEKERPRLCAVVATSLLEAWVSYLATLGVIPDAILPDSLVLPEPLGDDVAVTRSRGADVAMRTNQMATTVQADLVEALSAGERQELDDEQWRVALVEVARQPPLNLLRGDERYRAQSTRRVWLAAGLAAALAVSPVALDVAAGGRDSLATSASNRRLERAVVQERPELAGQSDAVETYLVRSEGRLPDGVSAAAAALFSAVQGVEGAELDAMSAEMGRGLSATVSYPDFDGLGRLTALLAAAGYEARDESTVEDGGRVVSGLRISGR